jgi:ABC-type uncharacterized transport system substrate-binding protein
MMEGTMIRPLGVCVVLIIAVSPAAAQARLSGHVTGEDGSALPGATIEVTGPGAVGRFTATTDPEGFYELPGLPPYQSLVVVARADGRIPVVYKGLRATTGHGTRRDFRLRPQGVRDLVAVLDARVPYHRMALEGALETAPGQVTVVELSLERTEDERLLRQALESRPNAVLAIGSAAARLARSLSSDIPIIYTMVMDPSSEGLEGTAVCGVALNDGFEGPLDHLSRLRPGTTRLLTIYDPRRLPAAVGRLRRLAEARGMTLSALPARSAVQAARALERYEGRADAFFLLLDPDLIDAGIFDRIRHYASERGMIFIVPDTSLVVAGGTFSYAPGFREMGAYAGRLAGTILIHGALPSEIGRIFPTTRYYSLNPAEAQRLDLTPGLLPR